MPTWSVQIRCKVLDWNPHRGCNPLTGRLQAGHPRPDPAPAIDKTDGHDQDGRRSSRHSNLPERGTKDRLHENSCSWATRHANNLASDLTYPPTAVCGDTRRNASVCQVPGSLQTEGREPTPLLNPSPTSSRYIPSTKPV